jgi:DNA-binding NtrC family response regulator
MSPNISPTTHPAGSTNPSGASTGAFISAMRTPVVGAVARAVIYERRMGAAGDQVAAARGVLSALGVTVEQRTFPACDGEFGERPNLILLEAGPGAPAFATLAALLRRWPGQLVLLISETPTVADAVFAMQAGACWFGAVTTGPDFERAVRGFLAGSAGVRAPTERRGRALASSGRIVGASRAIAKTLRQSALVAPTRTTVLILGETGTGKERLAQAIHEQSPRRQGPFVAVNCAALAESVLESELFGHERGAFSGAQARREGRFKSADGGTIFLDEVGEISLGMQVKLLRVLQERRFERVGGNETLQIDVRVIAATNRNLREMVDARTFRADLFYRLNVMTIEVPPLRERREDIPLLVEHIVPRLVRELGLPEVSESCVTAEAMAELCAYDWPGNVRELENTLQRALVMAEGGPITAFDLDVKRPSFEASHVRSTGPLVPGASFREIERHAIVSTYEACGRSPLRTAEVLGISPRTVHYRLREYRGDTGRRLPRPSGDPAAPVSELPLSLIDNARVASLHLVRSDARAAGPFAPATADAGVSLEEDEAWPARDTRHCGCSDDE